MGQKKPRGRKHMIEIGSNRKVIHDQALPETKPDIEWIVAKGWATAVESKDPGVFDVASLEKLRENDHDSTVRTCEGKIKYLQVTEFIGDPNFHGDYEAAKKQHSAGERFNKVLAQIDNKARRYGGDTKNVVLLIYVTDFRYNIMPIISVLGTLFDSVPPAFERIYHVSVKPDGSAAVAVIHPFRGTLLSEDQIRFRLGGTVYTPGPEDMIDK